MKHVTTTTMGIYVAVHSSLTQPSDVQNAATAVEPISSTMTDEESVLVTNSDGPAYESGQFNAF